MTQLVRSPLLGRPAGVEDERLLHPDGRLAAVPVPLAVLARGLPVPARRGAVGPVARPAPPIYPSGALQMPGSVNFFFENSWSVN